MDWSAFVDLATILIAGGALIHSVRVEARRKKDRLGMAAIEKELAERQLESQRKAKEAETRADLRVRLERAPQGHGVLRLWNEGAEAHDVSLEAKTRKGGRAPLEPGGLKKLPISVLARGDQREFMVVDSPRSTEPYRVRLTWFEMDGRPGELEREVAG